MQYQRELFADGLRKRTASLTISDDALNGPQTVGLTGVERLLDYQVTLSPNKILFGNQQIGSTSAAQTTTLQNTGHSTLVITNIAIAGPNPGDFAQTNNCGTSVAKEPAARSRHLYTHCEW